MNIALIGYGRMGKEIEAIAKKRGHCVKLIIDLDNAEDLNKVNIDGIDVAIEFSTPSVAFENIVKCFSMGIPVVSGTTGWLNKYDEAVTICKENKTSFIHSSNFSIGVNLLFRLNAELARHMEHYGDYKVTIDETHHVKKLDAPSGTAITLANDIANVHSGYHKWSLEACNTDDCVPVNSMREGMVPGTHTVTWESDVDSLILKHDAKNRKGLALGAIVAAEFIMSKEGVYNMNDVLGF